METVHFEHKGAYCVITIDNPPLNLTEVEGLVALDAAFREAERSGARAVLLRAAGDHFGPGVNVNTTFVGKDSKGARIMLGLGVPLCTRMESLDVPVVCAVQGMCLAAGLELALRCDIIIAAEDAKFAQVERHIGATTFLGGAHMLAARCGAARAREICFTGDFYDAATFERWNIVNKVVPRAQLDAEAEAFTGMLANGPTRAHAATKRLVREFSDHGVRAADDLLLDLGPPLFDSADFKAGVTAVVEHGSRNFRGKATFIGC